MPRRTTFPLFGRAEFVLWVQRLRAAARVLAGRDRSEIVTARPAFIPGRSELLGPPV
ncbi:hypothetical protein [Nocardia sp. XZ_19_231]|uniref:hypothetical protein n=1 Tax=Nocardia sp. XZ_19_231 TaxID=2769252 RepID=UPI00188FEA82|nr:hypothetical protein [Nocardia sp. XZ_19_231]